MGVVRADQEGAADGHRRSPLPPSGPGDDEGAQVAGAPAGDEHATSSAGHAGQIGEPAEGLVLGVDRPAALHPRSTEDRRRAKGRVEQRRCDRWSRGDEREEPRDGRWTRHDGARTSVKRRSASSGPSPSSVIVGPNVLASSSGLGGACSGPAPLRNRSTTQRPTAVASGSTSPPLSPAGVAGGCIPTPVLTAGRRRPSRWRHRSTSGARRRGPSLVQAVPGG